MRNKWMLSAIIILLLYLSPYIIFGDDAHVRVHDNLDSNVAWYTVMANTGTIFSGLQTEIPNIMNGVPRNSLGSEFNLVILLYYFCEPFTAYAINQFLMRFLAFFGMYVLLKRYFYKPEWPNYLLYGISLAYAMLPYWPSMGGSIAGLPLALFAFLNIRYCVSTKKDWLIIILLPFYTSLVLSFVFFLTCMSVLWLYDWFQSKRANWRHFSAMAIMSVVYLLVNYRIIYEMFLSPDFISHRVQFDRGHHDAFVAFMIAVGKFVFGQMHVIRLTQYIVLPTILIALVVAGVKKLKVKSLKILMALNILFSAMYGFYYWGGLKGIKEKWPIFETFNFGRFLFLESPLWYISFGLALFVIWKYLKWGKALASVILSAQLVFLFIHTEEIKYRYNGFVSYSQFYSEDLFGEIKHYIGRDPSTYRVASIGVHPAIAQYNGFYTLDGYVVSYPLSYKKKFRRIIAPELKKSKRIRKYFDDWGSRCYIFTKELGQSYMYDKNSNKTLDHLNLNMDAFKQMGGEFIFSAVKITNATENQLKHLKTFQNDTSRWRIYLYKVNR